MLATWHFHIEISSKCTLRCPRCARQEVPDTLVNTELDLAFFERNFTSEFVHEHVERITFCGDDGDPIYAHDLIPVIRYLKSIKPVEIVIITNGSHKRADWWRELGSVLGPRDSVHFSIDGYDQASNEQYRVNSDYKSILRGIQALRATTECQIIWAAIAFKFNEPYLGIMQSAAAVLDMDVFQITHSTKFGKIYPAYGASDPLQPTAARISGTQRFERERHVLTRRAQNIVPAVNIELYEKSQVKNGVQPLCEIGNKGLYIDSRGRLFPCCWVANRYTHNTEWQDLAVRFDLHQRTLSDAVADQFWDTDFQQFGWQECQTKCNQTVVNQDYATTW